MSSKKHSGSKVLNVSLNFYATNYQFPESLQNMDHEPLPDDDGSIFLKNSAGFISHYQSIIFVNLEFLINCKSGHDSMVKRSIFDTFAI